MFDDAVNGECNSWRRNEEGTLKQVVSTYSDNRLSLFHTLHSTFSEYCTLGSKHCQPSLTGLLTVNIGGLAGFVWYGVWRLRDPTPGNSLGSSLSRLRLGEYFSKTDNISDVKYDHLSQILLPINCHETWAVANGHVISIMSRRRQIWRLNVKISLLTLWLDACANKINLAFIYAFAPVYKFTPPPPTLTLTVDTFILCRWLGCNCLCSITWARWTKAFQVPFLFRRHEDPSLFWPGIYQFCCVLLGFGCSGFTGHMPQVQSRQKSQWVWQGNCAGLGSGTRHLGRLLHCSVTCSKYYNNTRNSNNNLQAHDTNTFHPDTGYTLHWLLHSAGLLLIYLNVSVPKFHLLPAS